MHLFAGNAGSLMLYSAPMLTFATVIKKRSTEEFSCVPYILALFNCCLYTWYGLPVVSHRWENFPVVTINGLGIVLELSFILIYFCFASNARKKKVALMMIPVVGMVLATMAISTFSFHDHRRRKVFVGSVGLVASVSMYSSPLVVVSPNLVGCPLGLLQLLLYCKYRKKDQTVTEEPHKWDLESCHDEEDNTKLKNQDALQPGGFFASNPFNAFLACIFSLHLPDPAYMFDMIMQPDTGLGSKENIFSATLSPTSMSAQNQQALRRAMSRTLSGSTGIPFTSSSASRRWPVLPRRSTMHVKCSRVGVIPKRASISWKILMPSLTIPVCVQADSTATKVAAFGCTPCSNICSKSEIALKPSPWCAYALIRAVQAATLGQEMPANDA
nr:bidirectional sugar transporter sweet3 [Ipomoea batatas]